MLLLPSAPKRPGPIQKYSLPSARGVQVQMSYQAYSESLIASVRGRMMLASFLVTESYTPAQNASPPSRAFSTRTRARNLYFAPGLNATLPMGKEVHHSKCVLKSLSALPSAALGSSTNAPHCPGRERLR